MNFPDLMDANRQRVRRNWLLLKNRLFVRQQAMRLAALAAPQPDGRPVVVFNASARLEGISLNASFSLLTAWALRLRGVPVVHFVCKAGMSRCVLGTKRENYKAAPPCGACLAQSRALYAGAEAHWFGYRRNLELAGALRDLSLDQMLVFEHRGLPLGALVLPSLRWALRRHHLLDDEATRALLRHYLLSAWNVAEEFTILMDQRDPRAVVIFNGQFYPEAVVRFLAQRRGLPVVSHETAFLPFSGFFTTGEATAYPIDVPPDFELDEKQNARLDAYLQQRFQGNFSMAGIRFWPEMKGLDQAFLDKLAGFRQMVPVFTNVIFDTSQGHANGIFPHMFAWLDEVLEMARAHPDTFFVIRAHPDESRPGKQSRESVHDWAEQRRLRELPNVLFVDSGEHVSSYEMIQRAKFVLVYNSTVGLEASLLGAAVLCGGKVRYARIPSVYLPATLAEYRRQAEAFLSAPGEKVAPDAEFRRNARRFMYASLYRASLPFADLLEEDGVWRGFVRLKPDALERLQSGHSAALRVVVEGILEGRPFLMEDPAEEAP